MQYLKSLNRRVGHGLSSPQLEDLLLWVILGVVLGGRIGYVLFYNLPYYLQEPSEIVKVWHGGMSFHGGLLGVITMTYAFTRYHRIRFFPVIDLMACVTPVGLCLGRIANFINGELYGRVTNIPWAMIFPKGGFFPRHPTQLYEAALEGIALGSVLALAFYYFQAWRYPRLLSGIFLAGYALMRSIIEFYRIPDSQIGYLLGPITMGHALCLPMFAFGIALIALALRTPPLPSRTV